MLDMLRMGEHTAGELVSAFPRLPQPGVSRHLRILREAGLVDVSRSAQKHIYSLKANRLREVDAWVSHYRRFWGEKLNSLETHLKSGEGRD